jgi:hypothetical protein
MWVVESGQASAASLRQVEPDVLRLRDGRSIRLDDEFLPATAVWNS